MKIGFYILIVSFAISCILPKKKKEVPATPASQVRKSISKKKTIKLIGDTTLVYKNPKCYTIVEYYSKLIQTDSLNIIGSKQSYRIGDTAHGYSKIHVEIYVEGKNNLDTLYYRVKLLCWQKGIPQFLSPNGTRNCWEIPFLIDYPNNTVKIYDRLGNLKYEKKGYLDHVCLDPFPENMKEGTHFYIIDLGDDSSEPLSGYVQFKR
ncbi:MAG: gliding motility-associated C-terminal domain-containing protein [Flavobacteriales bacterium]